MQRLADEPQLHRQLSEAGRHRAQCFDWNASAEKYWQLILKTAQSHG
jgi:glycosyltransferase involved in cell wall biosynthesis